MTLVVVRGEPSRPRVINYVTGGKIGKDRAKLVSEIGETLRRDVSLPQRATTLVVMLGETLASSIFRGGADLGL